MSEPKYIDSAKLPDSFYRRNPDYQGEPVIDTSSADNPNPEPARDDVERLARVLGDGDPDWRGYVKEARRILAALVPPGEALRNAEYVLRRTREAFWSFLAAVELTPKYAADDGGFQEAVQAACDGSCHSGGCITGCDNTCHGITSHVSLAALSATTETTDHEQ